LTNVTEERSAARELAERREWDAAALRVTERVGAALGLEEILRLTIDELGQATDVARSLVQLAPNGDGVSLMVEWDRGDTRPLGLQPPTPVAKRVFATGEAAIVTDVAQLDDPEIVEYLRSVGTVSVIAYPLTWGGRTIAVLGFQDDRPRSWRDHALPLLERVGAQLGAAIVQADVIAQQQEALDQLRDLARMREELIANVSHELRTPLAAILGSVKTLRRDGIGATERAQLVEMLDAQTERLSLLAEDLLDLSRFRKGTQSLTYGTIAFSQLVARARDGIEIPGDRDFRVRIDRDTRIHIDINRMCQVLANLIQNAVRHGRGAITLRCLTDGGNAIIHVSDEGGGIPEEYEDEMFQPFSHRSDRSDSSGLGLSIARAIVEAHGGTLVYLPPQDGRPHQFVVTLPSSDVEDDG
jgi:signal transduction histidine kinase